jgi:telomerase reverse transcriptase
VLNRLEPSYKRAKADSTSTTRDPRQIAENTRHLSKYIFARQYGLHTPFSSAPTKGFSPVDYMDREAEIKVSLPFF